MAPPDSSSLPPAFPPWMREADPILAAEDTNGLFQAFRARRTGTPWKVAAGKGLGLLFILVIPGIALKLLPPWLILPALIVSAGETRFSRNRQMQMPERLSDLFYRRRPGALRGTFALDMRLLPLRGSEVAEALYLEARSRQRDQWAWALCGSLLLGGLVCSAVTCFLLAKPPLATLWHYLPAIGLLALVFRTTALVFLKQDGPATALEHVSREVDRWEAIVSVTGAQVRREVKDLGAALGCGVMLLAGILAAIGALVAIGSTPGGRAALDGLLGNPPVSLAGLFLLMLLTLTVAAHLRAQSWKPPDFAPVALRADAAFPPFLEAVTSMED